MDQFIHLPEFRVIICKKYQYAILPSEIDAYFAKELVYGLSRDSRKYIFSQVRKIDDLIKDRSTLS